jgi:hypothetical protein
MDKEIEVGDVVYHMRKGHSGVPMRVLELTTVETPRGTVEQAICRGAQGWSLNGLISKKHRARVDRYALARLTHTPDSMLGK